MRLAVGSSAGDDERPVAARLVRLRRRGTCPSSTCSSKVASCSAELLEALRRRRRRVRRAGRCPARTPPRTWSRRRHRCVNTVVGRSVDLARRRTSSRASAGRPRRARTSSSASICSASMLRRTNGGNPSPSGSSAGPEDDRVVAVQGELGRLDPGVRRAARGRRRSPCAARRRSDPVGWTTRPGMRAAGTGEAGRDRGRLARPLPRR